MHRERRCAAPARRASEDVPGEYGERAQRSWSGCGGARMPGYLRDATLGIPSGIIILRRGSRESDPRPRVRSARWDATGGGPGPRAGPRAGRGPHPRRGSESGGDVHPVRDVCPPPRAPPPPRPPPPRPPRGGGGGGGVRGGARGPPLSRRAGAVPGETVLVHGASGGVGVAAVQIARAAALRVVGTAGTGEGIAMTLREGAHHAFDHRATGYIGEALAATGGRGFDVILEMLANVNLANDLKALAMGGRAVVIGSRGTIGIAPRDAMGRDASIVGMSLFNMPDSDRAIVHAALVAGLENGTLRPVIGRELPLSAAPESHVAVMAPGAKGKIVLIP